MCRPSWFLALSMAVIAHAALAQGTTPAPGQSPDSAQGRELMVAPSAPQQKPEAVRSGNAGQQVESTGRPANICQELVAFLQQEAAKAATPAGGAASASGGQAAGPGSAQNSAQGPATNQAAPGTAGPGQTSPSVDRPQQSSGQAAPIPGGGANTAPTQLSLDQAQSLARANDLGGCQKSAQQLRRAGVALPPGLLALAALRDDLLMSTPAQQPNAGGNR